MHNVSLPYLLGEYPRTLFPGKPVSSGLIRSVLENQDYGGVILPADPTIILMTRDGKQNNGKNR